jgi:hypothetical protein
MRRESILTLRITWDADEVDRPGSWDWHTLIDAERGDVEIVADSDDKYQIDILTENKL